MDPPIFLHKTYSGSPDFQDVFLRGSGHRLLYIFDSIEHSIRGIKQFFRKCGRIGMCYHICVIHVAQFFNAPLWLGCLVPV